MLQASYYTYFALKISWKSKSANNETTQTKKIFLQILPNGAGL